MEIAANHLVADIENVTGITPNSIADIGELQKNVVIIGTIGHNKLIDKLIENRKIDTSGITGQWETFSLQVIDKPYRNIASALVITGSDRRGTAFGIFELSRQIGVSPWYWWADVPVRKKKNLVISKGLYSEGPPSVKYRGILFGQGTNQYLSITSGTAQSYAWLDRHPDDCPVVTNKFVKYWEYAIYSLEIAGENQ